MRILEFIGETAVSAVDLIDAFLSSGYGASFGKLEYELEKRAHERKRRKINAQIEERLKQRYYSMLYKLKKDGLIQEKVIQNKKFYIPTKLGKFKLNKMKKLYESRLPLPKYIARRSHTMAIIVFDIPEKERKKRDWLRCVLHNLGFRMLQKSVWIGMARVPKEFLDDLHKLRIAEYIEIFGISKTGTIEQIV